MRFPHFLLFTVGFQAHKSFAAFRPDLKGNVDIAQLEPGQVVSPGATSVPITLPGSDFVASFQCVAPGKALEFKGSFIGCCAVGQHLSGSEDTLFDCCGAGHDVTGSRSTGYRCCITGWTFDGQKCAPPANTGAQPQIPVNHNHDHSQAQGGNAQAQGGNSQAQGGNSQAQGGNSQAQGGNSQAQGGNSQSQGGNSQSQGGNSQSQGGNSQSQGGEDNNPGTSSTACLSPKTLVDSACQCPVGQVDGPNGKCEIYTCSSGIVTGKCYQLSTDKGIIGYNVAALAAGAGPSYYGAGPESEYQRNGKFKFCEDQQCTPGLPVNPDDGFAIKDLNGDPKTGLNAGDWLDNLANGGHITKTSDYSQHGNFTITKWPCGKYCLGGSVQGIGPTCPATVTGMTFLTNDPDSCVEVELLEVPCDNHARSNNCYWKSGLDQCCGKVDCSQQAQRANWAATHKSKQ